MTVPFVPNDLWLMCGSYRLTHFCSNFEKLIPSIPVSDNNGNRPLENLCSVRIMHKSCDFLCLLTHGDDDVRVTSLQVYTYGSKYLEHISRITIIPMTILIGHNQF